MKEIYKKEINKLDGLLNNAGIPHEMVELHDGLQIHYPDWESSISDVVCHQYSYGGELGLLEQMGLVGNDDADDYDDVVGFLTAEQVFECWQKHWKENSSALCP